jgi:hypothetical protein
MRSPNISQYASCAAELALGGVHSSVSLYVFRYMARSQTIGHGFDGWPRYAGCVLYRTNIDNLASVHAFFRVALAEDLPFPQKQGRPQWVHTQANRVTFDGGDCTKPLFSKLT